MTAFYTCSIFVCCSDAQQAQLKTEVVPDSSTAIRIAEKVLLLEYGQSIEAMKPLVIDTCTETYWVVRGSMPKDEIGGVPYVKLSRKDGVTIDMYHTK
jgi:hypothetical protein